MNRWICSIWIVIFMSAAALHGQEERPILAWKPFDFQGVRLEAGPLRSQLDEIRAYYLNISEDDLLRPYRQRAGLPAPGRDLGGWYSEGIFHVFGQIVSGLTRLHAATGDPACRDKAIRLVEGWEKCIGPDGYFLFKPSPPHYIYDKFVGGLVDMAVYAQYPPALTALARITDWAEKNLDRSNPYGLGMTEWYTLSENLYRAYLATNNRRYLDFARVWEYSKYWETLRTRQDLFKELPACGFFHAYSHVNTLGGAGAAYLATGRAKDLEILREGYAFLHDTQLFPTGGFGPNEAFQPPGQLAARLRDTVKTFETQCGAWAGYKMSRYLMSATGDARYGDWIERLLWNGMAATVPSSPEGNAFYYSDYNVHCGRKVLIDIRWSCCSGTRPIAAAELVNLIYLKNAEGILVNQFVPSRLEWQQAGTPFTLRQQTTFPESDITTLTVSAPEPVELTLAIRVPEWLSGPIELQVNGAPVRGASDNTHHLLNVRRVWKNADVMRVRLPRALRITSLDPAHPLPAALVDGPVVLVLTGVDERPMLTAGQIAALPGRLEQTKPLHYRLDDSGVRVEPFYRLPLGQFYWMFMDPDAGQMTPHGLLTYSGKWGDGGVLHFTKETGAAVEWKFKGERFRWIGRRFPDAGKAQVFIDGREVALVDQYGKKRDLPFEWVSPQLPPGEHRLRLVASGERRPEATDVYINIAGVERISPSTRPIGE